MISVIPSKVEAALSELNPGILRLRFAQDDP